MTNEQTLLQTVLLLHKIQVPSSHQIDYEEDLLDCAKERTTTRTTKKIETFLQNCIDRNENVWTCPDVKLKLHPTTIDSHAKQRTTIWTSPDDFPTYTHFAGRRVNERPREIYIPDKTGRWYERTRELIILKSSGVKRRPTGLAQLVNAQNTHRELRYKQGVWPSATKCRIFRYFLAFSHTSSLLDFAKNFMFLSLVLDCVWFVSKSGRSLYVNVSHRKKLLSHLLTIIIFQIILL